MRFWEFWVIGRGGELGGKPVGKVENMDTFVVPLWLTRVGEKVFRVGISDSSE